jgi:hypothetical protein
MDHRNLLAALAKIQAHALQHHHDIMKNADQLTDAQLDQEIQRRLQEIARWSAVGRALARRAP